MNREKSELDPKQVFNFVGYQFDLKEGKVRPAPELAGLIYKNPSYAFRSVVPSPAVHVPHRSPNCKGKAIPPWSAPYEALTLALEEQLKAPRVTRKGDTSPQVTPPSLKVVAGGKQCASRSTITFNNASKKGGALT